MADINEPTHKEIWETLSRVNVNEFTEEKYGLTFLSWPYAFHILCEHFPQAQYRFGENEIHPDGSVTVHCKVSIGDCSRTMGLPVMDNRMNAITSSSSSGPPTSRDISDTKMRCLVKTIAMHGLGLSLWTRHGGPLSEALPEAGAEPVTAPEPEPAVDEPVNDKGSPPAPDSASQPAYEEGDEGYLPDSEKAADHWAEVTVKFIGKHCDDASSLDALWETDKETIAHVENHYPTAYTTVQAGFKQRYTELKETKNA
jgi:hypothetical protein